MQLQLQLQPATRPRPQRAVIRQRRPASLPSAAHKSALRWEGSTGHRQLSREDEATLVAVVQDALSLERVKAELHRILRREPSLLEWAKAAGMIDLRLFAERVAAGQAAKSVILSRNAGLVHHIMHKYLGKGVEAEDLLVAGFGGLMTAVERFNPARGVRLSTYAYAWVQQAMQRTCALQGRVVRLPEHATAAWRRICTLRTLLREELQRQPSSLELADRAKLPAPKIEALLAAALPVASLDGPSSGGSDEDLSFMMSDPRATPEQVLEATMLQRDVETLLRSSLSSRECAVLQRFETAASLRDLARRYGVSVERVRQIGFKAVVDVRGRQHAPHVTGIKQEYLAAAGEGAGAAPRRSTVALRRK